MRRDVNPLPIIALVTAIVGAAAIARVAIDPGMLGLSWTDKDFANYWVAATLALEGRVNDIFGPHPTYLAAMRAVFGADYPWHSWSYPPHYLLLMLPLGLMPYKAALLSFLTVTFLLFLAAARAACPQPKGWQLLLLLPPVLTNAYVAQNGFLLSALLLAGLALRDRRPLVAGLCFGLLTIKPQLGLLLPLLLLWERQWVTIAGAVVTTALFAALSAAVFGVGAWSGYITEIMPYQTWVMTEKTGLFLTMMPTLFGSVRSLGGDAAAAFAIHLPFAGAVLALYLVSLLRLARPDARAASTLFATTLAVPYLLNYDLVALVAGAVLWSDRGRMTLPWGCALALLTVTPLLMPLFGLSGWPVAPLVILPVWLGFLGREGVFRRVTRRPSPATP